MRTFIAIELPAEIKKQLGDIARQLRRIDVHAGWVKPDNYHLTLKFLGEVDAALVPHLAKQLEKFSAQHNAFAANLDGLGFFPSPKRPRILYAAIKEPQPLNSLAQDLERLLEPSGFAPEQRFHPHITLARIKSDKNLEKLQQLLDDIPLRQTVIVSAITLFGSIFHSDGVRYQVLQRGLLSETINILTKTFKSTLPDKPFSAKIANRFAKYSRSQPR